MPRPSCPTRPPVPPAMLDALACVLADAHEGVRHATLVRVRAVDDGPEVALCALPEGVHPADALVGHTVPSRWSASGLVAPAGARPVEAPPEQATPVVAAVLVCRGGHVAHHLSGAGPLVPDPPAGPPVGRLLDLLQRSLGLATAPPPATAAEWWQAYALDAVVTAAAAEPGRAGPPGDPLAGAVPPALLSALADDPGLVGAGAWPRLRRLAAAASPPADPGAAAVRRALAPFVDPPAAAWMDDGCFARWLLSCLPPADELALLASALAEPAAPAAVDRRFGVRRWPEPRPEPPGGRAGR